MANRRPTSRQPQLHAALRTVKSDGAVCYVLRKADSEVRADQHVCAHALQLVNGRATAHGLPAPPPTPPPPSTKTGKRAQEEWLCRRRGHLELDDHAFFRRVRGRPRVDEALGQRSLVADQENVLVIEKLGKERERGEPRVTGAYTNGKLAAYLKNVYRAGQQDLAGVIPRAGGRRGQQRVAVT